MSETADAPLCLPPRSLRNRHGARLPSGTCDTHLHVFSAEAPLASPRSYTPRIETIESWLALAQTFNIARGVLVQPSVYGLDNRALLTALVGRSDILRGVVVIDPATGESELARLHALGVRGIRFNLRNKSGIGFDALAALAPSMSRMGWHAQFQVGPDAIDTVADLTDRHHLVGVIDHLAFMSLTTPNPALDALSRALDTGRVLVKISAPYRLPDSTDHAGYRQVLGTLAERHPDGLLWGSDWPHTELFETVPDDDDLIALALDALPVHTHQAIFADNAQSLYWSH